jgi:hypothetical protein
LSVPLFVLNTETHQSAIDATEFLGVRSALKTSILVELEEARGSFMLLLDRGEEAQ